MRVLFLGGTSFTGPHAVRELAGRGHKVTVFHRGESEPELPTSVCHVHGDLSRWEEHVDDLRGVEPEVVVDMLAFVPDEGRRVLDFRGVARRAVVVSSVDVYRAFGRAHGTEPGPLEPVPLTEDSPLRKVVIDETYDKVGVEREATSDPGYPVTILRYPAVHGPGDSQHRLYAYVRRMDDGRPAILLGETHAVWRWARGYTEDIGHALALAVESEEHAGRIYHVAAPVAYEQIEWIRKIAAVVGWNGRIISVPPTDLPDSLRADADFTQHYDLDTRSVRADLGFSEVIDEETALERTIAWERANPPESYEVDYDAEDVVLASVG